MSKYSSYYSDDYDGPDMSEDEIHPYEGPDVACKECDREYPCGTHEAAKEELCPFCKGEDKFINTPNGDFLLHLIDKHQDEMDKFLFGDSNIGV